MKNIFIFITFVLSCVIIVPQAKGQPSLSQDSASADSMAGHHFRFVYIDHEPDTPVGLLCERLEKLHNDALEMGDKLIVYLANEDTPFVSFTNIESFPDSLDIFYTIIDELQISTYHEVNPTIDNDSIKSLIGIEGRNPVFNENGPDWIRYASVSLDFYIGKRFWALGYNEKVIASLYVSLQLPKYMQKLPVTRLAFNVLKPTDVELIYQEDSPFGTRNMGLINDNISILEYE